MNIKRNSYTELLSGLVEKSNLELVIPYMNKINEESEFRQFVFVVLFKLSNGTENLKSEIISCIALLLNFKYSLLTEFYTVAQIEETDYYSIYQQIKIINSASDYL